MKITRFWFIRALIGGHWEKSAVLGWYRHDRCGSVPPGVEASEDNTAASILIWGCVVSLAFVGGFAAAVLA